MTRTDIHRPSAPGFDPESYECVGVFDFQDRWGGNRPAHTVNRQVKAGFRFASHQSSGQCGHCGAHIRYGALMVHPPSKEMIYVGETCLDNRFESLTAAEFKRLRESAKLNTERESRKDLFFKNLAVAVEVEPVLAVLADEAKSKEFGEFVWDVRSKLSKWELSAKQIAAVARAINGQAKYEAKVAAEAANATPVPVTKARIVFTGEVLTTKWQESHYYGQTGSLKMLVKDDRGFKVWGTVPRSIEVEKGDRVTFEAAVKPSDDDATFGFFTRPNRASVLTAK